MAQQCSWFHTEISPLSKKLMKTAIDSNYYTSGSYTETLEHELSQLLNVPLCKYVNSGTAAIATSLIAGGITSNKTVGIPGVGWVATAQAAQITGAEVIVFDVCDEIPILNHGAQCNIVLDAIIPVNYNGRQINIPELRKSFPDSLVVEDSCKSLFSRSYNGMSFSGTEGDFGCYSLGMISALPGIYGGIISTHKMDYLEDLNAIKWHGVSSHLGVEEYRFMSFNFKSSNIHAACALGMLEGWEERREKLLYIYEMYENGLHGLENNTLVRVDSSKGEIPLLVDIKSTDRAKTIRVLADLGIQTCNYHPELGTAPNVKSYCELVNSKKFAATVFHPPCGPDQPLHNVENAIKILKQLG